MANEERKFKLAFRLAEQENFLTLSRRAYARALGGGTDEAAGGLYVCLLLATASKTGFSGKEDSGIAAIRVQDISLRGTLLRIFLNNGSTQWTALVTCRFAASIRLHLKGRVGNDLFFSRHALQSGAAFLDAHVLGARPHHVRLAAAGSAFQQALSELPLQSADCAKRELVSAITQVATGLGYPSEIALGSDVSPQIVIAWVARQQLCLQTLFQDAPEEWRWAAATTADFRWPPLGPLPGIRSEILDSLTLSRLADDIFFVACTQPLTTSTLLESAMRHWEALASLPKASPVPSPAHVLKNAKDAALLPLLEDLSLEGSDSVLLRAASALEVVSRGPASALQLRELPKPLRLPDISDLLHHESPMLLQPLLRSVWSLAAADPAIAEQLRAAGVQGGLQVIAAANAEGDAKVDAERCLEVLQRPVGRKSKAPKAISVMIRYLLTPI